jgi:hypothetical protein
MAVRVLVLFCILPNILSLLAEEVQVHHMLRAIALAVEAVAVDF